jgi:hypothetical protein
MRWQSVRRFSLSLALSLALAVLASTACSGGQASRDAGPSSDATPDRQATNPSGADAAATNTVDGAMDARSERISNCVPTGPEICDGKDNDCDGVVDDGFS